MAILNTEYTEEAPQGTEKTLCALCVISVSSVLKLAIHQTQAQELTHYPKLRLTIFRGHLFDCIRAAQR
jgi:hypothetical protein